MLSVGKLTLGQEAYYERQVARGLDDYYAGRGESPGIWAGSASAGLVRLRRHDAASAATTAQPIVVAATPR